MGSFLLEFWPCVRLSSTELPRGSRKGDCFQDGILRVCPPPPSPLWREVQGGGGENNTNVPRNLPVPLGTKVLLRLKPQNTPLPSQVTLLIHSSGPTFSGQPLMFVMRKSENRTCALCREQRPLAFAKAHFKHLPPRQDLFRGKHFRNYVASHAAGSPWNTIGSGLRMGAIQLEWWRFCTPEGCCVWKALGPSPRIQGPWGVDAFFRISYTIGVTLSAVFGACQWRPFFALRKMEVTLWRVGNVWLCTLGPFEEFFSKISQKP